MFVGWGKYNNALAYQNVHVLNPRTCEWQKGLSRWDQGYRHGDGELMLDYIGGPILITQILEGESTFPDRYVPEMRWGKKEKFQAWETLSAITSFENGGGNHKPRNMDSFLKRGRSLANN